LVSKCDVKILIVGETGTGKELFARAIHYLSPRAHKPFVAVNCGAIPFELVENELFGHERGAYTGASASHAGLIHEANTGTLFLDEIDSLPFAAQVKLLRFIQDNEYRPLGSTKAHKADVRLIVATNSDLQQLVQEGKFRQDLYYRLNIISFCLPPLRERREDIPCLALHFLSKYAEQFNKQVSGFCSEAMQRLLLYDWPGNVRELENLVERGVVLAQDTLVRDSDIFLLINKGTPSNKSFQDAKREVIEQFEKNYIQSILLSTCGNISKAAAVAKKNRRAFWQLIRKHSINASAFRAHSQPPGTMSGFHQDKSVPIKNAHKS
jgi:two-component system response regulator GlrR